MGRPMVLPVLRWDSPASFFSRQNPRGSLSVPSHQQGQDKRAGSM